MDCSDVQRCHWHLGRREVHLSPVIDQHPHNCRVAKSSRAPQRTRSIVPGAFRCFPPLSFCSRCLRPVHSHPDDLDQGPAHLQPPLLCSFGQEDPAFREVPAELRSVLGAQLLHFLNVSSLGCLLQVCSPAPQLRHSVPRIAGWRPSPPFKREDFQILSVWPPAAQRHSLLGDVRVVRNHRVEILPHCLRRSEKVCAALRRHLVAIGALCEASGHRGDQSVLSDSNLLYAHLLQSLLHKGHDPCRSKQHLPRPAWLETRHHGWH
mmetsp:Transcript_58131/g.118939  ORF Transcript_58131/g.118939 Transcript_58131/m.118939 type:complete len:264 (-) Transcript_58131:297-1088(-)